MCCSLTRAAGRVLEDAPQRIGARGAATGAKDRATPGRWPRWSAASVGRTARRGAGTPESAAEDGDCAAACPMIRTSPAWPACWQVLVDGTSASSSSAAVDGVVLVQGSRLAPALPGEPLLVQPALGRAALEHLLAQAPPRASWLRHGRVCWAGGRLSCAGCTSSATSGRPVPESSATRTGSLSRLIRSSCSRLRASPDGPFWPLELITRTRCWRPDPCRTSSYFGVASC